MPSAIFTDEVEMECNFVMVLTRRVRFDGRSGNRVQVDGGDEG